MHATVKEAQPCPTCGNALPAGALAGLCPACLLAQGAETEPGEPKVAERFEPLPVEELAKLFPSLEILGLLGAGGMGAVYKARQPALDRLVALKILPGAGASGSAFAERFNREARALARLSHPNIVAVHEFGQAGALHYFIMEYVEGANLRQLERASRLAPREALQIIPQICDALQYAHDEGVVHRDIKPENVLVDRKGRVKIADFGLAKILGQEAESLRLTREGQVMGTPHYMAPEQVEHPLTVDHRADIYSLGVVFYEMLTGDLPLGKFSPPSRKVQVDVRFDEVVLRALENDPERRYQRVSEVKTRVETITSTPSPEIVPVAAPPAAPKAGKRFIRWARFPVVLERDGEREISWNGTLSALLTTSIFVAIGFLLVRAIMGTSMTDGLSLQVCMLMAFLTVMAGVRGALNSPSQEEESTSTPGGWAAWWRAQGRSSMPVLALEIVGFVLLWCWFQIHWLTPWLRSRFGNERTTASQVAVRDAESDAPVAKLQPRDKVESLTVSAQTNTSDAFGFAPIEVRSVIADDDNQTLADVLKRPDRVPIRVSREVLMDGSALERVGWAKDPMTGFDVLHLELNGAGRQRFAEISELHIGRQLAFLLQGGVVSAPFVRERIDVPFLELKVPTENEEQFTQLLLKLNPQRPELRTFQYEPAKELVLPSPRDGKMTFLNLRNGDLRTDHPPDIDSRDFHDWRRAAALNVAAIGEPRFRTVIAYDAVVLPAGANAWKEAGPMRVLLNWELLAGEPAATTHFARTPESDTYFFRTKDDLWGVLQVVDLESAPAGVRVRYKLVRNAGGPEPRKQATGKDTNASRVPPETDPVEPPRLRFLAWQHEWKRIGSQALLLPDGSPATNKSNLDLIRAIQPTSVDVSATEAGKRDPRFLHLWFSHPFFDRRSLIDVTLWTASGESIPLAADGSVSTSAKAPDETPDHVGWLISTFSPGEGDQVPRSVTVRLRYACGPLQRTQEVASDFNGSMALANNSHLNGIGQDAAGYSFISLAVGAGKNEGRQIGALATTKDGRELEPSGSESSGFPGAGFSAERIKFKAPLADIRHFKIGARPVRTIDWENVVLLNPAR